MRIKIGILFSVFLLLCGLNSMAQIEETTVPSDTTTVELSKKEQRKAQRDLEFRAFRELLEKGTFFFEASLSHSSEFSSVELNTAYNYLTMKDSVALGAFSYFGRSTNISMKDNLGSVNFEGKAEDYKVVVNEKKRTIKLTFKVHGMQESYLCVMNVDSGGYISFGLSSQYKSYISYTGQLFRLIDKEDVLPKSEDQIESEEESGE